jgi:aspartyl-tRNA(Asn)/glutamyl-tRNA(Gln) amidotransferase subunit B
VATLEAGGTLLQETRGWNEQREISYAMRIKETENDYRYFPDPDLVPMAFTEEYIESLRASLPELPLAKTRRYQFDLGLSAYDAGILIADRDWAMFFEDAVALGGEAKAICNWMNSDFAKLLNENGQTAKESKVTPAHLVDLNRLVSTGAINGKMAKDLFKEVFETGRMPAALAEEKGASQITDRSAIEAVVREVLDANAEVVAKFRAGNQGVKGFLVGQVMKKSGGRANPQAVQEITTEILSEA